jgi:hypothetical protein
MLTLVLGIHCLLGCAHSNPSFQQDDFPLYSPPPDAIVLRVSVLKVEFTDWHPACQDQENCIPMSFWHRYRAEVREVVSGSWSGAEVEFSHLQHAEYIRRVTRDCYVVLRPASTGLQSRLGVEFVADKILSRFFEEHRPAIKALTDGP